MTNAKVKSLVRRAVKEFDLRDTHLYIGRRSDGIRKKIQGYRDGTIRYVPGDEKTDPKLVNELAWYLSWNSKQRRASYRKPNYLRIRNWLVLVHFRQLKTWDYRNAEDMAVFRDWLTENEPEWADLIHSRLIPK